MYMKEKTMKSGQFSTDIQTLGARARQHIDEETITPAYKANPEVIIQLLNGALAMEFACVLRYKGHYFMASGINSESVREEFLEHANEEQTHADLIAQRIVQLGGEPNLSPEELLSRSGSEYREEQSLIDMIKEDLIAERIVIDSYREMILSIGNDDPTSRRLLEDILTKEEEHAEDIISLLKNSIQDPISVKQAGREDDN
jgi:bacterioferritin